MDNAAHQSQKSEIVPTQIGTTVAMTDLPRLRNSAIQ